MPNLTDENFDPCFREVPKNKACFYIFRVVQMEMEKVPNASHGSFYSGDCYIIYSSKDIKGRLEQNIHYWIGSKSSQDEQGTVAIKTVALDTYLGGAPIQHREVEGHESNQFQTYFPKGIKYLEGGAASGFNHVTYEFKECLYQVKGKKTPRVRQVPLAWSSFNDGDCFILDLGKGLFVWKGKECYRSEALKASQFAVQSRDERGGSKKCALLYVDSGCEKTDLEGKALEVWDHYLPLKERKVKTKEEGERFVASKNHRQRRSRVLWWRMFVPCVQQKDILPNPSTVLNPSSPPTRLTISKIRQNGKDEDYVKQNKGRIKLYSCREEKGTLKVSEVKAGPLAFTDLVSEDAFIVDNGETGVWVWVGKNASDNERKYAVANAENYVAKKGYSANTPITRVIEGGEPTSFKCLFQGWPHPVEPGAQKPYQFNHIAKTQNSNFDAAALHDKPKTAAESQMVDDGSGEVEVFRIRRVEKDQGADYVLDTVPKENHGHFYGGDCYIIAYTYLLSGRQRYILYYWIGQQSTQDEQTACAALTVVMDTEKFDGAAVQTRVRQGKEPRHFMTMFQGYMIIWAGGHGGWDDGENTSGASPFSESKLFHVYGMNDWDRKCVEVKFTAESLNSNDVFVLSNKTNVYIWTGKGSSGDERQVARTLVEKWAQREPVIVIEGQEKDEFWDAIGGKKPYASDRRLHENKSFTPRLFQCSNASGMFRVEEIIDYTQTDLSPDDVFILDADDTIFGWVGQRSNKEERELSMEAAIDYINTDPSGRDPDIPIVIVKQGFEPPTFTGFFHYWDESIWSNNLTYEELKAQAGKDAETISVVASDAEKEINAKSGNVAFSDFEKFPYSDLVNREKLPNNVNVERREYHLSTEEFEQVFGMPFDKYEKMAEWKRKDLKKKAQLF